MDAKLGIRQAGCRIAPKPAAVGRLSQRMASAEIPRTSGARIQALAKPHPVPPASRRHPGLVAFVEDDLGPLGGGAGQRRREMWRLSPLVLCLICRTSPSVAGPFRKYLFVEHENWALGALRNQALAGAGAGRLSERPDLLEKIFQHGRLVNVALAAGDRNPAPAFTASGEVRIPMGTPTKPGLARIAWSTSKPSRRGRLRSTMIICRGVYLKQTAPVVHFITSAFLSRPFSGKLRWRDVVLEAGGMHGDCRFRGGNPMKYAIALLTIIATPFDG